jgi:diguanylate cyclase (GGDEF)-like protein
MQRNHPDLLDALRKDQQIAALRAQNQLTIEEKLRQQLVQEQQQFQLDAMARRSQLQSALSALLLVCLLLTVALAWSLWRVSVVRKNQALEDPLTGLKNRRFLVPFMEHETGRLRRSALSALILIVDIDHFKSVNDRWGHDVGDEALVQFTGTLRRCVRKSDVVARWGGEEFALICPESSENHVELICSRIRHQLQQTPVRMPGKDSFHLTVSIGAALFAPATSDESWTATLARADRALYRVKRDGRDGWSLDTSVSGQSRESASVTP